MDILKPAQSSAFACNVDKVIKHGRQDIPREKRPKSQGLRTH
jgi:hypothetical protein